MLVSKTVASESGTVSWESYSGTKLKGAEGKVGEHCGPAVEGDGDAVPLTRAVGVEAREALGRGENDGSAVVGAPEIIEQ